MRTYWTSNPDSDMAALSWYASYVPSIVAKYNENQGQNQQSTGAKGRRGYHENFTVENKTLRSETQRTFPEVESLIETVGVMMIQSGESTPEDIAYLNSGLLIDRGDNLRLCFEFHEHDT